MTVEGKVVVVTGVTSGAGQGIVRAFLQRGAKVVGTGRRLDRGQAFADEVGADGGAFTFVQADVTRPADGERTMEATAAAYGPVDILVNNAGTVGTPSIVPSHEATEDWWDDVVDTNLKGAFFSTQAALKHMLPRRSGAIWNISSINGIARGPARTAAYTAAKGGLIALTQTLAVEYIGDGIRINAIALGTIEGETGAAVAQDMARYVLGDDAPGQDPRRAFTGDHLGATLALLSEDDVHLNGAIIPIDGAVSAGLLDSKMYYRLVSGRS